MGIKEDFESLSPVKALIVGFVLCVVYYFVIFNKGEDIVNSSQSVQQEIDGLNKRLAAVQEALNNKVAFEEQVKAFTKELEELLKFFPNNLDMNDMQKEFTERLTATKNKLIKINDIPMTSRFEGYVENGIELEMLGNYHGIMGFLSEITKMDRVVDFKLMELEAETQTDELSIIKFKLHLAVFAQDKNQPKPQEGQEQ